jgi:hypothetical protein
MRIPVVRIFAVAHETFPFLLLRRLHRYERRQIMLTTHRPQQWRRAAIVVGIFPTKMHHLDSDQVDMYVPISADFDPALIIDQEAEVANRSMSPGSCRAICKETRLYGAIPEFDRSGLPSCARADSHAGLLWRTLAA